MHAYTYTHTTHTHPHTHTTHTHTYTSTHTHHTTFTSTHTHTHTHAHTDYISNFMIYLAVLQLLRKAPLVVRHTICQQVISMLHLTPFHVAEIAKSPGWESLFLWLLTPIDLDKDQKSTSQENLLEVGREGTYQRVRPEGGDKKGLSEETKVSKERRVSRERRASRECQSSEREFSEGGNKECPVIIVEEEGCSKQSPEDCHSNPAGELTGSNGTATSKDAATESGPPLELEPTTTPRKRTNAFLDSSTVGARSITISGKTGKKVVEKRGGVEELTRKRRSLTYNSSWSHALEEKSDEVWRTFGVVTETIGYMLWRSPDYENDKPPWKVQIVFSKSYVSGSLSFKF